MPKFSITVETCYFNNTKELKVYIPKSRKTA